MRVITRGAGPALLAAVLLASCAGNGGTEQQAGAGRETTTTSAATGENDPPTAVDLEAVLLTLVDLPSGFTRLPRETADNEPLCKQLDAAAKEGADAQAQARFFGGQKGPFVEHEVNAYSGDRAAATMRALAEAIDACATVEGTGTDGKAFKATFTGAPFPDLGDERLAARLEVDVGDLHLRGDVVFVRAGTAILAFAHSTVEPPDGPEFDPALTERLIRRAVEKLERL